MVNKEVVNDSKVVAKAFEGKNIGPGDSERRVQKDVNLQIGKKDVCYFKKGVVMHFYHQEWRGQTFDVFFFWGSASDFYRRDKFMKDGFFFS